MSNHNEKMEELLKNGIPSLLKEKLGVGYNVEDIVGYSFEIGYLMYGYFELPDIEDSYEEKEKKVYDGKTVTIECSGNVGYFAENAYLRGADLIDAHIDVYFKDGEEQKTIRIDEEDYDSVFNGPFEQLHLWLWKVVDRYVTMNNLFVGEDHLCIQQHISLNTSLVAFSEEILKQAGYSLSREDDQRKTFRCELPVFGSCTVTVHDSGISGKNLVGLVVVKTIWKINEAKMLKMLDYMKQTIGKEPHYDDHGYGVSPRPHEIDLRWDLPQGRIGMTWDGFNYTYGTESNHPKGDGTDFVFITLRDRDFLQAVEDKESYGYFHYEDID